MWRTTMQRPAKILIAGIATIFPLLPPITGAATSQVAVTNDQTQSGSVAASQQFDINAVSDQTTAVTTATGNTFSGATEVDDIDVQSGQSMQGSASANTTLNV